MIGTPELNIAVGGAGARSRAVWVQNVDGRMEQRFAFRAIPGGPISWWYVSGGPKMDIGRPESISLVIRWFDVTDVPSVVHSLSESSSPQAWDAAARILQLSEDLEQTRASLAKAHAALVTMEQCIADLAASCRKVRT